MTTRSNSESILERVFREISRSGETSIRFLARETGVSLSTLEDRVRPFVRKGLVEFLDGRNKIALRAGFGHVVGIDMGASHLHYALADFRGDLLTDATEKVRPEDGPRKMIAQIKERIRSLTGRRGRLRALAMGVPSPVDALRGVVAFANNLPGWKNIHLGRELQKEFRVPVFLENDANMAAIGEHWRGVAQGVDNFVFIALGTGIGSGIFIDGKLHRGRTGSAGELWKMNLEWPRWDEDFGNLGYFENYVSGQGIAAEGRKMLRKLEGFEASSLAKERDAFFVFEALRQGNAEARQVLEKIFTMLGVGVANIVAVLDPDLMVFGGGVVKGAPDFLLSTVEKVVRRIQPDPPPLKLSSLEDKGQTYGAIFSALTLAQEAVTRRLA